MKKIYKANLVFVMFVLLSGFSAAQIGPGESTDAQSTSGPVPPPETSILSAPLAMDSQKLISGVPAYIWYNGCGPTAAGMVLGYWDSKGFDNLVPGSASTQTAAVNNMISSSGNYNDYCLPRDSYPTLLPDKSELPAGDEHPNDSVADFMRTSQSVVGNYYGWSWYNDMPKALQSYAQMVLPECGVMTYNRGFSSMSWSMFTSEIDAGRPLVFLVDSNSDGATDHFVTIIGYGVSAGVNMYACWDTWSSSVRWCRYTGMASGQSFGIYGGTFFSIAKPSEQVAIAKNAPTNAYAYLRAVPVTACFNGYFYIEETDRSCGIRVNRTNHGLTPGSLVDVVGSLQTSLDGEKYIQASSVTQNGSGGAAPLAINNRCAGGSDWFYNAATNAGQRGVDRPYGINNIGLLVRTTGRVTYSTTGHFYIDDGSKLQDGSGRTGLKINAAGLSVPPKDTHAQVTGVSSCFKGTDDKYHPQILVSSQSDIMPL